MSEEQPTTEKESPPAFEGFIKPKKNYFPMPNAWIDICAEINNLAELKVVQYVLRHTWGYQEYGIPKAITIDEFMHGRKRSDGSRIDKGTGLSKQGVVDGVKRAVKHEYLLCTRDDTDKARISKAYMLKMQTEEMDVSNVDITSGVNDVDIPGCQESRQQMSKTLTPDVKETDSSGLNSRQRSEKDTLERHSRKTLEERQESDSTSESQLDDSGSVEPTRTHFAFQIQGYGHFYHDYCIHAQDRGINDGLTLVVKNLADVPPDAECSICYKPVHGPHGYGEPVSTSQPTSQASAVPFIPPSGQHGLPQQKGTTNGRSDDNDHLLPGHDRRDTAAVRSAEPVRVPSQQAGEHEVHPAEPGAARAGRSARTESGATQPGLVNENNNHSQLSTSQQSSPQTSAKVSRPSSKSAKQTEPKLPPTAEHTAPVMPPADAEWKTTTCLLMFTAWRGAPLIGIYKNSQASTCAKALVQNYSRAQVEAVRAYMVEQDEWWSQHPEKVDVCSVGAHIHEKLAEMARKGKPAVKPKPTLVSCANMSAEEYAAYLRR